MDESRFYNKEVETLGRDDLDSLIDERVSYTISYAAKHSPFYRDWFHNHHINPGDVRPVNPAFPPDYFRKDREGEPAATDT